MPETFPVDCSGLTEILLERQGLTIQTDRLALNALAARLDTSLPENPRVLVLGPNQFVPITPEVIILGPRSSQLPELRDENDIIINLPNTAPTTQDMTIALAGALLLTKAEERKRDQFLAGVGIITLGLTGSCVGYVGIHNRLVELAGGGLLIAGGILTAISREKAKVDLPNLADVTEHPILLTRQV